MSTQTYLDWLDDQQDQMVKTVKQWSNINSGSYHSAGLAQMQRVILDAVQALGGTTEIIELAPVNEVQDNGEIRAVSLGKMISVRKRPDAAKKVLFCGHMDTVFSVDHPFQTHRLIDDNTLNGPGVADMKGGIIVMLKAIEAFERSPDAERIGWEILLNPDEEIGSPGSAPILAARAKTADIGLVYEPSLPDGALVGERKGSGNFSLIAHGRAAHAGREHHLGRNAIAALSAAMLEINALNEQRAGATFNLGRVSGGGAVNIVPDTAVCHFNIRIVNAEDREWAEQQLQTIVDTINQHHDGIRMELYGHFGRPPKVVTTQIRALLDLLVSCGDELGLSIGERATGGCCDGNNLAAAGLPNVDTLGVRGAHIHSANEHVLLDSFSERAKLSALLLMKLAADPAAWPERMQ